MYKYFIKGSVFCFASGIKNLINQQILIVIVT